jgi:hypothetical protein
MFKIKIILVKYIMTVPLLFEGKLNGVTIFMYGEDHSNINNNYYKRVSKTFMEDDFILVEHSTNACEIKPEEEHLFREHAKGTEWIFYTQKKLGNPNVICFDTRSENGYLNAFQEKRLFQIGFELPISKPQETREYIDGVMYSLKTLNDNSEKFEVAMPGYFDRSFKLLKSQLDVVIHFLRLKKQKGDEFPEKFSRILSGVGHTLIQNLRRVASVSVDIDLADTLIKITTSLAKKSIIHVFCGRNHVVRMVQMLGLKGESFTREVVESAEMEVEGDLAMDAELLQES